MLEDLDRARASLLLASMNYCQYDICDVTLAKITSLIGSAGL
jgi:hypothetical protein